jgi:hypothetical protein
MIALNDIAPLGFTKVPRLRIRVSLVGAIALTAAVLVGGGILARGFSENGFRLGSELAWRFTCFVFFAMLIAGPVARLAGPFLPSAHILEDISRKLIWGFCASYAVYLAAVLVPNAVQLSAGATLFVLFGAGVTAVMAATAAPLTTRWTHAPLIGARVRRTVLGIAAIYFWLCYALMALARISGPHRPDDFYGLSLCLMIAALLLRFADRWTSKAQPQTL